jgi:hypothetical protein
METEVEYRLIYGKMRALRNRPIEPNKWYIVDTYNRDRYGKPKLLKKRFDNKKQIKMNIKKLLGNDDVRFDWIRGSEAISLNLRIMNRFPSLRVYLKKYNYENYMITIQDRKSYRTKFRRQNRNKRGELYGKWG